MADERVRQAVKITDPVTDANEASVDASGNLQTVDTNLATAAALSDAFANPTTTQVGAMLMGYDGTDWQRVWGLVDGDTVAAGATGFLVLGTDGVNYQAVAVDAAGNLQVDIVSGAGGPQDTDDDIVAGGQSAVLGISLTYGWDGTQWERVNTDASGSMDVNVTLALPTGANTIGSIASITTSVTPGTAAANLGKAEDVASAGGDTGVAFYAVQDAALTALTSVDGDYTWVRVDANGALWTSISAALPTGTNSIGDIANITTTVTPGTAAGNLGKAVDVAAGASDTGVAALAIRDDSPGYAAEVDGDYVTLRCDANGRLHVTDPNAGAGSPTNATVDTPALATVAAGATSTGTELRTTDLGNSTRQLAGFDVSSSVPFKATLIQEDDDVETVVNRALFGKAGDNILWRPPHKAYFNVTFGNNAGFDGWRVEVTNHDNSQSADFYVNFYYED